MNNNYLVIKILLGLATATVFVVMHFSTNYLAKRKDAKRCLKLRWDDKIAFVPFMIYFYLFTYIFNTVCLFLIIYNKPFNEFVIVVKMMLALILIGGAFYIFFPTAIKKPILEDRGSISLRLVKLHNDSILPYNAFPSLHVAFSLITVLIAFYYNFYLRFAYLVLLILISLSALLTKQHYIIDIIAGLALGSIIYIIFGMY